MKRVSFNVAKALKEAGYPQYGHCEDYYDSESRIVSKFCEIGKLVFPAPTYFEVWLWLQKEKDIPIDVSTTYNFFLRCYVSSATLFAGDIIETKDGDDQEEAIEKAIEYLCDNKLIN